MQGATRESAGGVGFVLAENEIHEFCGYHNREWLKFACQNCST